MSQFRNLTYLNNNRIIYRRYSSDVPTASYNWGWYYAGGTYGYYALFNSKAKINSYKSLKWHLLVLWYLNPSMSLNDFREYFEFSLNDRQIKKLHNLILEITTSPKNVYKSAYYAFNLKLEADNLTKGLKEEGKAITNQSILISTLEYLSTSLINQTQKVEKRDYRYSELLFKAIEEINRGMRPRIVLINTFIKAMSNE